MFEENTGTDMEENSAISIEGLTFAYDGSPVLEDVNLEIGPRDFVSVVGPNGGGKTTLLKLLLGLLHPQKGIVRVFGLSPEQARPRIGYMPQSTKLDLQFPASVMDVVLMGRLGRRRLFGPYAKEDKEAAIRKLADVGLDSLRNRAFSALSGGQRQRLLIARALACEPDLLLLDEPTANLDVAIEEEFYELLRNLNERLTIVLVSHDLGFVSQFVRSVVCVKRRVLMHPTSEITGEMINTMYGASMKMVRHDRSQAKGLPSCFNS